MYICMYTNITDFLVTAKKRTVFVGQYHFMLEGKIFQRLTLRSCGKRSGQGARQCLASASRNKTRPFPLSPSAEPP